MEIYTSTAQEFVERIFNLDFNDVYILPNRPIRLIDGFQYSNINVITPPEKVKEIIQYVKKDIPPDITDFSFREKDINLRIHLVKSGTSKEYNALIIRKLFSYVPEPNILKVPSEVVNAFLKSTTTSTGGIALICGKQRQGKSTTAASLLNIYNTNNEGVIITIENPIEYTLTDIQSVVIQKDVITYVKHDERVSIETLIEKATERALIDASREFPSIVFIGELRTKFEVEMAVKLAESGVFVLTSFHGENVPFALSRFMNILLSGTSETEYQTKLANFISLLKFVVAQRLLPNKEDESKFELISEYYIPNFFTENIGLLNLLKQRKMTDFLTRFSKMPKSQYVKNFTTALSEAVSEGRINSVLAREIDPYRIVDLMRE
jgi:Tfp pilus assembly pilus retraction ATPase PilT